MSDTSELTEKDKTFAYSGEGKYFHKRSAIGFPVFPQRAEAFKLAADMILDAHEAADDRPHNDRLLFPVLYLYRHCLEVQLKDLIRLAVHCDFYELAAVEKILRKHRLEPLWEKARPFLIDGYKNPGFDEIEAMVQLFDNIDDDGQTLRYERTLTDERNEYETLPECIDVPRLRKKMDSAYTSLAGWYGGIKDWWVEGQQAMDHVTD